MGKFSQFEFGEETFGTDTNPNIVPHSPGTPPPIGGVPQPRPEPIRTPWTFYDGLITHQLLVNPNEAAMPMKKKRITHKPTSAGRVISFEGRPEVQTIEISGIIMTEAQFRTLESWAKKRKQIRITDDIEQSYWVYFKQFSPTRRKSETHPWLMDYSLSGVILDRG